MKSSIKQQNYYELLDIPSNADQETIIEAYKKARAIYNPNSPALYTVFDKDEAEELLKMIDEAYNILSNQFKRQEYDKKFRPTAKPALTVVAEAQPEQKEFSTIQSNFNVNPEIEDKIKSETVFTGQRLQQIRLYKNMTIDQIAEATKISRTFLNAIESQNYEVLPAPVFLRGFLVQYGKILGLDGNKVARSYLQVMAEGGKK